MNYSKMKSTTEASVFVVLIVFLVAISSTASQSFVQFGSYEYYVERKNPVKSYSVAESRCRSMKNATLAVVNRKEINDFLIKELGKFRGKVSVVF